MMTALNGSLTQVVSFTVGTKQYAVEIDRVIEIVYYIEPNLFPEAPAYILGVIDLRGTIIPVLHLEAYLGMKGEPPKGYILVVRVGLQTLGIMVDEVYDVMHVTPEQVQDADHVLDAEQTRHVKAVIRAADRLLLLLDLDRFSWAEPDKAGGRVRRPHS